MRRGEHLEDRVDDMEAFIEDYFGQITTTEEYNGNDLHVVEEPKNPVFQRVTAGTIEYSGKKNKVALDIEERPAEEVIAEGHVDAAEDAVTVKNDFLEAATGRDAKARRDSLKRDVEDDAETPDNV
jgi:carboxypeptidase C (cathepsin A)